MSLFTGPVISSDSVKPTFVMKISVKIVVVLEVGRVQVPPKNVTCFAPTAPTWHHSVTQQIRLVVALLVADKKLAIFVVIYSRRVIGGISVLRLGGICPTIGLSSF